MKMTFPIIAGILILSASSYAQGLVNFVNNSSTLVTINSNSVVSPMPGALGGFRFELFAAPAGTLNPALFTSTGLLATNLATPGRLSGGINLVGAGLPLGGTVAILVRGWSSNLGTNWQQAFLNYTINLQDSFLGVSSIAPNFIVGGFDGTTTIPTSPAFGGGSGIQSGFSLIFTPQPFPEPSTFALTLSGFVTATFFKKRHKARN